MARHKSSDEEFLAAVQGSVSYTEIARKLGIWPNSSSIRRRLEALGCPTPDLIGRQGVSQDPRSTGFYRKSLEDLSDYGNIKHRLIHEFGVKPECSRCQRDSWMDEYLPLELDHIDGDPSNNVIENLRLLCPNCHSLTPTWRGRNRKKIKK